MANEKIINARVQQKIDIEANWNKATFTPKKGEIIFYAAEQPGEEPKDENGVAMRAPINYLRWKVGNGNDSITDLPFASLTAIDDGEGNVTLMFGGELNG